MWNAMRRIKNSNPARPARLAKRYLRLEHLERRAMLSVSGVTDDGSVVVTGTEGDDVISAKVDGSQLIIEVNGSTTSFPNHLVKRIEVNALAGNDSIDIDATVKQLTELNGGAGHDKIGAGSNRSVINGGGGNDSIIGSPRGDRIDGAAGDDTIDARGGNDRVQGYIGSDEIDGGRGNGRIDGDPELVIDVAPAVEAEVGEPRLRPVDVALVDIAPIPFPTYNDVIQGGPGHDAIRGSWGNDLIHGGPGNDRIDGGFGNDGLLGDDGNDGITGGFGHDAILGGRGHDNLSGGPQSDAIAGGDGNDVISGNGGNDWLFGDGTNVVPDDYEGLLQYALKYGDTGNGRDRIRGGDGGDIILSGNGNDNR